MWNVTAATPRWVFGCYRSPRYWLGSAARVSCLRPHPQPSVWLTALWFGSGPQPGIFRDIQADPGENNFIQDLPDLHDAILAHLRQAVDRSEEALSSERAAALRQMGYVDAAEGN